MRQFGPERMGVALIFAGLLLLGACGDSDTAGEDDIRVDPTTRTDTSIGGDADVSDDTTAGDTGGSESKEPPALVDPLLMQPASGTGTIRVQPAVAIDAAGRVGVAFTGKDGDQTGIFFTLYDAANGMMELVPAFLANTDQRGLRNEPTLCALAGGGFVLGWSVDMQTVGADGENTEVRFRRFNASGAALDAEDQRIYTERPGNHWLLDLACGADGGFVASAVRPSGITAGFEVFAQRYNAAGDTIGDPVEVAPGAASQIFPRVAVAGTGAYVVAWEDSETLDSNAKTLARVFDRPGTTDLLVTVAGDAISASQGALVAADPDGTFVLGGFQAGLRLQHLDGDTLTPMLWPESVATAVTQGALVGLGGDRFAAVYYTGTSSNTQAKVAYFDGASADGEALTTDTGRFTLAYQPAIDYANGRLVAAWTESLSTPENTAFTIHLALFTD